MSGAPKLTVVIPCFNDGPLLKQALASVFAQTFFPSEILVVNDGSTDRKTINILRNVESSGITVIHQENRGLSGARNTGIRQAHGQLVYFLDADNVLYPHCLSTLVQLMQQNPAAIAAASRIRFMGGPLNGTEWSEPLNPYILLVSNQWDAGIMLRKEAVDNYDLWYDETMRNGYEDWEFHIRLARTGKPIAFYPEPLYQYRVRRGSLLSTSRKRHAEIVLYIRAKHGELYEFENLLAFKRSHMPAVLIHQCPERTDGLQESLTTQTLQDWAFDVEANAIEKQKIRYHFFHAGAEALRRLPVEALEGAVIALECNPQFRHCVLSVKNHLMPFSTSGTEFGTPVSSPRPVALMIRASEQMNESDIPKILGDCELLIEYPDRRPDSEAGWNSSLRYIAPARFAPKDETELRKRISQWGRRVIGPRLHGRCVRLYDRIYGLLVSERSLILRQWAKRFFGQRLEQVLANVIYGLFLMKPPTQKELTAWRARTSFPEGPPPLFLTGADDGKINILIATSWLNEGGVEQEIFDLCRNLDPSRFRLIVATTQPSSHPWDHLARKTGAYVYHLADILRPAAIQNGLLHLALNHHIDCLHIVHSRAAYESLKLLKNKAPWLQVIDRSVILDPNGGGFPFVSAKIGQNLVDVRTVGHVGLAEYMAERYRIPQEALRVIYAGTEMGRIESTLSDKQGLLHTMCHLSSDTPMVIFVGRLVPQKRPEILVRSVAKIFELQPECKAHFALVGDGELKASVEKLVRRYNLKGRIHLLGAHPDAISLIADSTLLMMPSAYEGLALVSYEAMALGIPQIFANVNGQAELITPETGILIDNGRGEETRYAKACLELLADPDRRARMAAAGKDRIKDYFSAENAVQQYAEIFEQMAELSRKRAAEIPHLRPPHINPLHELA